MDMKNKKPVFVTIKPDGFLMSGVLKKTIDIFVKRESQARKFWQVIDKKRNLVCFSSNGKISKNGDSCNRCIEQDACQLKLRIFFNIQMDDYCLELPVTSYENYLSYKKRLSRKGFDVKEIVTEVSILNRGYWGEVRFREIF